MIAEKIFRSVALTGAVAVYVLPQTVCLQKYRQLRARYGYDNVELPVQKEIQQRFEEVLHDVNVPEIMRERIKLFNVHDIDVFHAGTTYSKYGAIIGVPANFEYKDINKITNDTISFEYKQIDWDTQIAKEFKQSLVLSENAQKFALAFKVLKVLQIDVFYKSLSMIFDMGFGVIIYSGIANTFYNMTQIVRIASFCACLTGMYIVGLFIIAELDLYRDTEINKEIIGLGSKYIEGAAEYYEKLLTRNKALRALLGDRGPYLFTSSGNESFWHTQRGIPISEQVDFFKSELGNVQLG